MKSLKWAFLALTLFAFTLNSCKKSANSTPKVTNTVALNFNGTAYTTSTTNATYSTGALQIISTFNSTTVIHLLIQPVVKVGSFDIASGAGWAKFDAGPTVEFIGTSGNITITSFTSTTVAGTFQFSGPNTFNSNTGATTSGTFQTTYTTQ
jgi:hypothetical protein